MGTSKGQIFIVIALRKPITWACQAISMNSTCIIGNFAGPKYNRRKTHNSFPYFSGRFGMAVTYLTLYKMYSMYKYLCKL